MHVFVLMFARLALLLSLQHLCGVLCLRIKVEPEYFLIRGVGRDAWMEQYQGSVDQVALLGDVSALVGGQVDLVAMLGGGAQPDLSGIFGGLLTPKRPVLNASVSAPPGSGTAQVMCSASGSALASCEFRLQRESDEPVLIDMNLGTNSPPQTIQIEDTLVAVKYHGRGLAVGDCGLSLSNVRHGGYRIGCRGRKANGVWAYGFALIDATSMLTPYRGQVLRGPRRVVARVGNNVTMLVSAPGIAFQSCVAVPSRTGMAVLMFQGPLSPLFANYRYHGRGLPQGECGVQVLDVQIAEAGPMFLGASFFTQLVEEAPLLLVEHGPAQPPQLSLRNGQLFAEGDILEATCTAMPGFPAATLAWSFAGSTLRAASDKDDSDPLNAVWRWPWEARPVTQTVALRRPLTLLDDGAELVCKQRHPAASTEETRLKIAVDLKVVSQDCGRRATTRARRVTHASEARPGQFPWQVGLYNRARSATKFQFRCGGTLVSETLVVTAAHCVVRTGLAIAASVPMAASDLRVTLGSMLAEWQADKAKYVQQRAVAEVAGWGATHDSPSSPTLRWVQLPVASRLQCADAVRNMTTAKFLTSDKFCAGTAGGSIGTCKGDSGGGLVIPENGDDGTERFYLRGVVSVAFAKQQDSMPCVAHTFAAFTDISRYVSWIEKFLRDDRLRALRRRTQQNSRHKAPMKFPSS